MNNIKFQIYSLGCKVNQYDSAVLKNKLEGIGFAVGRQPDLVVINTCSVTKKAISKDQSLVKEILRDFPSSKVVVMGCWPQTDDKARNSLVNDKIIFWGVGKIGELIIEIKKMFPAFKFEAQKKIMESGLIASFDRSRYFIKVGDGCNQFCSYCIIPYARGRLNSRLVSELIEEIEAATVAGYREIVLSGIHLGRYGEDKKGKDGNLVGLIKKILKIKNLGRIRLSSIEINEVSDGLIELMKSEKKICRHLHISLQSGSDKILKLMNRPYGKKYFFDRLKKIRKILPDIAISTDIIVGFPGESEKDFIETYNFSKRIKFSKIHVFSFSAHEKTPAYRMPGKVTGVEIKRRSQELRDLSCDLEKKYQKQIISKNKNKPLSLIRERGAKDGKTRVKTEFGFDLYLSPNELEKHSLI